MNDGEFVMPEVWIGCPVEASVGKSRGPYSLAFVLRKKTRSVDLVIFSEGQLGMMFDCWHDDDPRVQSMGPDAWEDNTRGTWHLTQSEIDRRRMIEQVRHMEAEQARQTRRLEALEQTRAAVAEPAARPAPLEEIKPRPGRGRPRKDVVPLSEVQRTARLLPAQFSELAVDGGR